MKYAEIRRARVDMFLFFIKENPKADDETRQYYMGRLLAALDLESKEYALFPNLKTGFEYEKEYEKAINRPRNQPYDYDAFLETISGKPSSLGAWMNALDESHVPYIIYENHDIALLFRDGEMVIQPNVKW